MLLVIILPVIWHQWPYIYNQRSLRKDMSDIDVAQHPVMMLITHVILIQNETHTLGPFIRGKISCDLHKTRLILSKSRIHPYKWSICSLSNISHG